MHFAAALATLVVAATAVSGRPVSLHGGQHTCSYTNPQYMLSDYNMHVHPSPGSTRFTASWVPGHRLWEDAYWVTGWHNENSHICDKRELPGTHGAYGASLTLPLKLGSRVTVKADLQAHGAGRLGFDLWFAANRLERGPHALERDRRTWEVLIYPGHGGVYRDNPGWHRVYLPVLPGHSWRVAVRGLNLTRLARLAGVPAARYWIAVAAGAETTHGSFTVTAYHLYVAGDHPKPHRHPVKHRKPPRRHVAVTRHHWQHRAVRRH